MKQKILSPYLSALILSGGWLFPLLFGCNQNSESPSVATEEFKLIDRRPETVLQASVERLWEHPQDPQAMDRVQKAIMSLKTDSTQALPLIFEKLLQDNSYDRALMQQAFQVFGLKAIEFLQPIAEAMPKSSDEDQIAQDRAAQALTCATWVGIDALPLLKVLLRSQNPRLVEATFTALRQMGKDAAAAKEAIDKFILTKPDYFDVETFSALRKKAFEAKKAIQNSK